MADGAGRTGVLALAAAGVGAVALVRGARSTRRGPEGWKSVTVLTDAFAPGGRYPEPLAALADGLEIRLVPATRERGVEVHARPRRGSTVGPGALRAALRDSKALVETGIVQASEPVPHGHRNATPAGTAVDAAEDAAKGSGIL